MALVFILVTLSHGGVAQKLTDLSSLSFTPEKIPSVKNPGIFPVKAAGANPAPAAFGSDDVDELAPASLFYERENSLADYFDSIVQEESEDGPYSAGLIEELSAVGVLNQQQGRLEEALENFKRALHITRVNYGLYSLEQIPVMEHIIEIQMITGNHREADVIREAVFRLRWNAHNENDISILPVLTEYADWQVRRFEEIIDDPAPVVKFQMNANTRGYPGYFDEENPRFRALLKLYRARYNYIHAIQLIVNNGEYTHPELTDLERKLARTFYLQYREGYYQKITTGSRIHRIPSGIYRYGRNAFERILIYRQNDPDTSKEDMVRTLMEMGDWSLVFRFGQDARKYYQEAYQLLSNEQVARECVERILSPQVPVYLPDFNTGPVCPNVDETEGPQTDQHLGYIDVHFKINQQGRSRELMILGKSLNTTPDIERRLRSHIHDSIFRPNLTGGRIAEFEAAVRYYYDL